MTIACDHVGAHVVDALPEDQRVEFVRHLVTCAGCQREVGEFSETVAKLASTVATAPPAELRPRVLSAVARVRPLPPEEPSQTGEPTEPTVPATTRPATGGDPVAPVVSLDDRRTGRRGFLRWGAAAAAVGVVGLGAATSISGWRAANSRAEALAAQNDLLAAPDAQLVPVDLKSGGRASYVVSRRQNRAMFVADGLPPLPEGKVFQQWTLVGGRPIPNVTFTSADQPVWLTGDVAGADNLAITVENEGGAHTPNLSTLLSDPVEL